MKIDIFYHDKFKFSFERDLSEIYLDRIKSIPKIRTLNQIYAPKSTQKKATTTTPGAPGGAQGAIFI